MNLYYLYTTVNDEEAIVTFKDSQARLANFFIENKGDGRFLNFTTPLGKAQDGYNKATITSIDYLNATISIPVFSQRFVTILGEKLKGEISFHECTIACEDSFFKYFIGKTEKYLQLIDTEKSQYRTLTDGNTLLSKPMFNSNFEERFFIARDKHYPWYLVVSEHFKQLVKETGLTIDFLTII